MTLSDLVCSESGRAAPNARARTHDDRGASMIEFGMLLPIFVLFAFGIVEFGLALTNFNAIRNGAREGARSAVVAEFGTDTSCPIRGGGKASDETKGLICLTKARVDLDEKATSVKIDWSAEYKPGDPIVVCVSYPLDGITGMFDPVLAGRSLRTRVEMRIERLDDGLHGFAEPLPDGRNWDWC